MNLYPQPTQSTTIDSQESALVAEDGQLFRRVGEVDPMLPVEVAPQSDLQPRPEGAVVVRRVADEDGHRPPAEVVRQRLLPVRELHAVAIAVEHLEKRRVVI